MTLPLPDGSTVRALRREDAPAVAEILAEDERQLGLPGHIGPQDINAWWMRTDLEHDSWVLEELGAPVAGGWLDRLADHSFAVGWVRPGAKGRGFGTWLVERSERHARELGFTLLRQVVVDADQAARQIFDAQRYHEARRHYDMAIELTTEPAAPHVSAPLAMDTFRTDDARAFHAASKESFADEWGFSPMPFDRWWEMRSSDPDFDPSLWFVVRDGECWSWTYAKSQKVRNLERDPRCTVQVETGREYQELRGVMLETEVVVHRDPEVITGVGLALLARYSGGQPSGDARAGILAQAPKRVGLEFRETRRATWDHRKLGGGY